MSQSAVVLIVEDQPELAESLQALLAGAGLQGDIYPSGESALREAPLSRTGCAILDMQLPGMSGLDLHLQLRSQGFAFPTLFLTGHATVTDAIRFFERGAFRVFEKPLEPAKLVEAVQHALSEEAARRSARAAHQNRLAALTGREREILDLLIDDKPIKQIARELRISPSTVEKHRANILFKFDARSVVGLIRCCLDADRLAAIQP